jgi:hypothetical protein
VTTWIKLHDNFWRNPKVLAAGEDAGTLYIQGLCYCSDSLTDGEIPTAALRTLTIKKDARTLARILVREGLWAETSHGWAVHDYLEVQRSRAQIEAEREKSRTRQRRWRDESAPDVTPASRRDKAVSHGVSHGVSHADVTQPEAVSVTETDNPPYPPVEQAVTPDDYRLDEEQRAVTAAGIELVRQQNNRPRP